MKTNQLISALFVVIAILFFGQCKKENDDPGGNSTENTIELRVTANESGKVADIEYDADGMQSTDINNQSLPWSTSFNTDLEAGDEVTLKVTSGSSGAMTAEILIDGAVVKSKSDDNLILLVYIKGL